MSGPGIFAKAAFDSEQILAASIRVARGLEPADLVIKNAQILDVFSGVFRPGDLAFWGGRIVGVHEAYDGRAVVDGDGTFAVPGFIDAHVHIESSLLTPARFQQAVMPCGTTSVIWDPHEIANVKGAAGIRWALEATEGLSLDVFVMLPSCVPSTSPALGLESSGAQLTANDLLIFRDHPRVLGLAEMMNYPGLLAQDLDVLAKLVAFSRLKRDGHCPGLSGRDLNAYGVAGIHSCHESTTLSEASEKLAKGIAVLIREGSCAKDADALLPLLNAYTSACVGFCSDDRNPADIAEAGHINAILDKALIAGCDPAAAFRAASFATARAFGLDDRGALAPGLWADVCLVEPRNHWRAGMTVKAVYKRGALVQPSSLAAFAATRPTAKPAAKNLLLSQCTPAQFKLAAPRPGTYQVRVIGVRKRQILTDSLQLPIETLNGELTEDLSEDRLKIAVLERHFGTGRFAVGFVRGFGLKSGAIATSINHDAHNVIAVGASDELLAAAVNRLLAIDGGIVVVTADGRMEELALPIAGLMTDMDPLYVAACLGRLKALAHAAGCVLEEPFLQLSFLALPVIPALKLTDRGLVDVSQFGLVGVIADES